MLNTWESYSGGQKFCLIVDIRLDRSQVEKMGNIVAPLQTTIAP